jgi:hypothetical protein
MLVYLIIAVVVVAAIYQVLIGQNRLYMKQRELQDVRTSLRAAANLLAFELRQLSAADSDLHVAEMYEIALRSVQGSGVVCGIHGSQPRLGLYNTTGDIQDTENDSALIFAAGSTGTADDRWVKSPVTAVYSPAAGGVPSCAWSGASVVPDLVVAIDTAAYNAGVQVGAPFREFRQIRYGSYHDGERWWLGRKVGAAADWEKLTGPLGPPSDSGLVFVFRDINGSVTADPTQVRMVDIILRGESFGRAPQAGAIAPEAEEDSLTLRVSLRG